MQKIVLIIVLSLMTAMGGCKTCGNHDLGNKTFSLQAQADEKDFFLGKKSKPSIQIGLSLTPSAEADKDMQFKVSSINGLKGKLFNEQGEEVSVGSELKRGDHIFSYLPDKIGDHDVRIEVSDATGDIKQNARVRLHVKEKTARFKMDLKEMGGKKSLLTYQEGNLHLEVAAIDDVASKLEYTIKNVSVGKGKLLIKGGEELKEGEKLEFRGHDLVFVPDGELGTAIIKLTLENEEGHSSSASTSLEIKPVEFNIEGSFELVDLEKGELKLWIGSTGSDLDKESFKLTELGFSDKVVRPLKANHLGVLRPGMKVSFGMKNEKIEDGVKIQMKLEGAAGVYQKEIEISDLYQRALLVKQGEVVQELKVMANKGDDLLFKKRVEDYQEVLKGLEKLQKEMGQTIVKANKLEVIGLEGPSLLSLQASLREVEEQLAQIQALQKDLAKKKFAFEARLIASKRSIFSYQQGEMELVITSFEKENTTASYTVKQVGPLKGKLKFEDGAELKVGSKVVFGKKKLFFKPSREDEKEHIEILVESDKGTSSKAELELKIKPVDFSIEGSFELVDLERGELKLWISATGNDLDKESFKLTELGFSDKVARPLKANHLGVLRPGMKVSFGMKNEKIEDGLKIQMKLEGAAGVYEKEIGISDLYQRALLVKQGEVVQELKVMANKGDDLLFKKRIEEYEEVLKGLEKLQKEMGQTIVKANKLEAIGLEGPSLLTLRASLREVEEKLVEVQALQKELAKKKFGFKARLEVGKQETFTHIPVALKLSLTSSEPLTRKLEHHIKDIVITKGKVHGEKKTELIARNKLEFGDNNLIFVPSGEIGEAKVKLVMENEQGAEDVVEAIIDVKPVEFKVHVGSFDTKGSREGYGKLEVSIETDKLLEKESFKVVSWKFKQDQKDRAIAEKLNREEFREFKENMCLLVAGGREEKKIAAALKNLEAEKEKREKEKNKATKNLNSFLSQAQEHQSKLEGYSADIKRLEGKLEAEKSSSGTLRIATKYDVMEKVKVLEDQTKETGINKVQFEKAAYVLQEQINRDEKIFEKEDKKAEEEKKILEGKKKVWEEMKKVGDKKFNEELQAELLSERLEKKESHPLSGEHSTRLYVKLVHASMPSILVLKVEGPGGVAKEVEVNIREGVDERLSDKASLVIKNLTEVVKVMDQKLKGNENGEKYHELTKYLDGLELDIKVALTPLRESYGEDWWTNPSFMELKNSRELTEVVLQTMDKLRKLEEMQRKSKNKLHSFDLDISFDLPKGERVWAADYLDMKIGLKEVDPLIKKKAWKVMSWKCDDDAVILAGEKGKVLSEVILSADKQNKLHIKFPSISLGYKPKFLVKVGCFDGEELIMQREVGASLGSWVQLLFEENVGKFIGIVKEMNKRIEACFGSKSSVDHRFDTLANMEIEAKLLKAKHEKTQREVGGSIKNVAFLLSEEMKKKVVEYADQDIPRLESNIKLLEQRKGRSKIKNGTVEELENIDAPDENGNLLIHKWAGEASISAKDWEVTVKATKDVNVKNKDGRTALHVLLKSNLGLDEKLKRMEVLLKAGASINIQESKGNTPLHIAVEGVMEGIVKFLIKHGANLNAKDEDGNIPLDIAIRCYDSSRTERSKEIISLLLTKGGDVNAKDENANMLIHKLAAEATVSAKDWEAVVKATKDLNAKNDKHGDTPLLVLLKSRLEVHVKAKRLSILLADGADVNAKDKYDNVALCWGEDHVDLLKIMLHYKLDLKMGDRGHFMLRSVSRDSEDLVRALLDYDPGLVNIDYSMGTAITYGNTTATSWTPLHVAAACNHRTMADILLAAGANKNVVIGISGKPYTPYKLAIKCENYTTAEVIDKY